MHRLRRADSDTDGYDDSSYEAGCIAAGGSGDGTACAASVPFEDSNADTHDDSSYDAGFTEGAASGDLNLDETIDVLDIVQLVNILLGRDSTH